MLFIVSVQWQGVVDVCATEASVCFRNRRNVFDTSNRLTRQSRPIEVDMVSARYYFTFKLKSFGFFSTLRIGQRKMPRFEHVKGVLDSS